MSAVVSLTKGGVFTDSMLDAYIELKMGEVRRQATHPTIRHVLLALELKSLKPIKGQLRLSFFCLSGWLAIAVF
jgi:hypothetical protein